MCPCEPIDDFVLPSPPPGFGGLPVPQLPGFDIPFPSLPLEDLLDLFNRLNIILPPGIMRPHLSAQFSKNILDAILSLLEKFMPFLMMYAFFMPVLNMILCIIEVFCALMNPFKLIRAIRRLFRVCIPEFLSLFPFFALIIMIISLLLLILALILYLIQRIIDFIRQIIANIRLLAEAVATVDNDSVIAITIKLGDLLCIFQNIFALLGVIIIIFQVIERLLNLGFKLPPCDDNDGGNDGCCTPDVCPSFIKNNVEIISQNGVLQYFNNVIQTSGLVGAIYLRRASFQLYDPLASTQLAFNNITHAFDLPPGINQVFFPEGETYTSGTTYNSVPYTVDIRFFYNPILFGREDNLGARFIRINNCIVLQAPVDGVRDYQNNLVSPFNGTLSIGGGTAFEDDGITIMKVNPSDTAAATLETVVFLPDEIGISPILSPNDGILFDQVTYNFKINHTILVAKNLITVGCHPDVAFDKNFINNAIGSRLNISATLLQAVNLPDVQATQDCIINAINTFRQSVSVESAEQLQTTLTDCMNNLKDQTNNTLADIINIGFDPFSSDFTIDPTIQFTTKPINVIVTLNESNGNNIASNLPLEVGESLADNLSAVITLGNIGGFDYDGYGQFIAQINSDRAGNGTVQVAYQGQFISILDNPTDIDTTPTITVKELMYTFVQSSPLFTGTGGDAGSVRRDEGDISRDGTERG